MQDNAAKNGTINVICGLLGQIITIVLGIVIPRLVLVSYGSEVNGLLNSVTQIFTYFGLLEAGVGVASLQALYAPVATNDRTQIQRVLAATHHFYMKAGTIYILAVVILAFVYPFFVETELAYGLIVGIILFGGLGNCINFLYQGKYKILMQADGHLHVSTNITTIFNVLTSLAKVALLLMGFNVLAVQFSFFVVNILQMLMYLVYVRKHYAWIDLKVEPDNVAIEQKGSTLIHQISGLIFNSTDVVLLTVMTRDLKVVSIYTMYKMVITMATTLIQQIEAGFNFKLGQMYNTDRKQYMVLHHIFEIVYMIMVFAVMTAIYVMIVPFMRLYTAGITDVNYINKWYPLYFVITPLLTYGRTAASDVINFAGHFKQTQNRAIAESVINIVTSIIGIWKFGIFGALLGTFLASFYRTNDIILYVYKHLLKDNPWKTYKRWISCFVIFVLVVVFVNVDNPIYSNYGMVILGGALWGIGCLLVYALVQIVINPKETKDLISIIKGTIAGR